MSKSNVRATKSNRQKANRQAKANVSPALMHWRFFVVMAAVVAVFAVLAARAAYIQVIEPDMLLEQGDARTLRTRALPSYRGIITDRHGEKLAVSVPVRAVWANPSLIAEHNSLADARRWQALADVLGQDLEKLLSKITNPEQTFVYLQRQVTPAMANYVQELKIKGVFLRNESRRYYPSGEVSAHVVGVTNVDDQGQEGVEKLYNQYLSAKPGSRTFHRDAKGRQVELLAEQKGEVAKDLQLTIDQRIQALAYKELKQAVNDFQATSGSAVIVDARSGEILALVNSPSYNPNNRNSALAHRMRNRAITDAFEPGSSVKPLAVLGALEFGSAELDTRIDTSPGWVRIGGSVVRDGKNHKELDLTGIVRHSSNIGTSRLALSMPKEFMLDLYYNMGLMSESGTNLIGESSGIFHQRNRWSDFELSTLSFGYGLSVTTLQLARMYSVLANDGVKQPLSIIKNSQPKEQERVVDAANARAILQMMESVVSDQGPARKAQVAGYRIAGKTGTSRKAIAGGYGEEYVNIFAGVAPASNPQLVGVVLINEPQGDLYYASDTAAPVFAQIMSRTLQILNVTPDAKQVNQLASLREVTHD